MHNGPAVVNPAPGNRTRYRLDVRLTVQKVEERADGDGRWYQLNHGQDRLEVSEDLNLGSLDFQGMLGVLAELHNAVKAIAAEEE